MNSKERVHAALNRQPVDRIPIFMWFHPETETRLAETFEIPVSQVGVVMGNDIDQAWVGNNYPMAGIVHPNEGDSHVDDWGVEWVKEGGFNQIRHSPLQDADDQQMHDYRFPEARLDDLLANMKPILEHAREMFIGCDISPCVFEMHCRLRGMENAIMDLGEKSPAVRELLKRCGQFSLKLAEAACDRFPLDWLWTGDDVGGQQCIIMSPDSWRELIRPHLAPIFKAGKSRGLWVAYHSCGAIRPIIGDLVEMGLDVLNPIQGNCPGMEPLSLKKEFGRELAFMGGVDTQELLPRGSAGAVRKEIERLLEGMTADGGGYILAASHSIPPETPLENIYVMYEAAGVSREEMFDRAAQIRREHLTAAK